MTNEPRAGQGLDPELLAAYIDQRLSPEQRAVVEAQLAADPDSHAVLVETLKALDAQSVPKVPSVPEVPTGRVPTVPWVRWAIAGGVLAAAAALFMVVRVQPDWWVRVRGGDPQFERLVAAVGQERYTEARLAGGFPYGPLRSVNRATPDLAQQNVSLLAAAGELQKTLQQDRSASTLNAWGTAQLLLRDYDGAVTTLREATDLDPSARNQSNLAAALLERATSRRTPVDLPAALNAAESALQAAPNLPEARYNRALALELLGLTDQASEAWQAYLEIDRDSPWSADARERLARLARPQSLVDPFRPPAQAETLPLLAGGEALEPARLRFLAERSWLSASCAGSPRAPDVLSDLGRRYQRLTGDASLVDAGTFPRTAAACQAYQAYQEAAALLDADRLPEAAAALITVAALLKSAEHPITLWADYHRATIGNLVRDFETADRELRRIALVASRKGYLSLEAHGLWTIGVIKVTNNQFKEALADLLPALEKSRLAAEQVLEGRLNNQLADVYEYLGDSRQAWVHRSAALDLASRIPNRRLRHSVYGSVAAVTLRRGMLHAGRAFLDTQYRANVGAAPPASMLTLLLRQVDADLSINDLDTAARRLGEAEAVFGQLRSDPRAPTLGARLLLIRARHALQAGRPAMAIELADEAMPAFDRGRDLQAVDTLLVRARALREVGRASDARTDVAAVLEVLGTRRSGGASFFGSPELSAVQAGIDDLLDTDVSAEEALRLADASRRLNSPAAPARATGLLPSEPTLYYKVLPGKVRAWLITQGHIVEHTVALPRRDAVTLVKSVRRGTEPGADPARASAALEAAFALLLQPFAADLRDEPVLRVVADWPLDGLPFAALKDPRSGRFVVEDRAIVMAPLMAVSEQQVGAKPTTDLLVLADPERDAGDGGATPLPWAMAEGDALARLYDAVQLLSGPAATPGALLTHAPRSRIVHVAAHAAVDRDDGRRSRLLLASESGRTGDLYGEQLVQQSWTGVEVVVLAACATAEADGRPTSPMTLASQVLAAGPRYVIATLRPIDDRHASRFFLELHRLLSSGVAAPQALQRAQLQFIDRHPAATLAVWSPIAAFGS